jgi:hypothetical protein
MAVVVHSQARSLGLYAFVRPTTYDGFVMQTTRTFVAVLFIGLFAMAARNVDDPDVWWHLKTGEYIASHKAAPRSDIFSYTRAGRPWVAHEWLAEFLMYEVQRLAGFAGLIVIFGAIVSGAFFLLYLRCGSGPYVAGIVTLLGAWATRPLWGVRPQMISLLFASLWLLILERSGKNQKLLWFTLPLTVLWVNLHAGFALGLMFSAGFLLGNLIECLRGRETKCEWRLAGIILLLDLLLVPLNPNGVRMFSYPIETLRSSAMQTYIAEWASPNFHRAEYAPFLLLMLIAFATLYYSRLALRPRDLLFLLAGLFAALVSTRMIPFFVLIAVPIISCRLGAWPRTAAPHSSRLGAALNLTIILAMSVFAASYIQVVIRRQPEVEARQFPAGAVAFLQSHPPRGHIFNHYDWGGYLIWKLNPEAPVFIDGRADVYGEQLFHEFADVYQLRDSWKQILEHWRVQTVLVPTDSALSAGLRAAPGWTVAYADSQAIIWTAAPPAE